MHRKILSFVLVLGFILTPLSTSRAESVDTDALMSQLRAISAYLARTYGTNKIPLSEEELRTGIQNGAEWLKKAQEENGHFRYEYIPYEGRYRNDDNIVRQAGALYALGEIVKQSEKDALELGATVERSIEYFENLSRESTENGETFRCITKSESSTRCPLGATSLALIGVLSYIEHNPEEASLYRELADDYITYILAMQKDAGGFRDTYTVESTKQSDAESAFSNGEALLALVRYYEFKPSPEIKEAIDTTFTYLRAQPYDANLYLWIMAGLKDMQKLWPNTAYTTYAKGFTDWRIARAVGTRNSKRNYCAYAEGLASAVSVLTGTVQENEVALLRDELGTLNRKHFALQLTETDIYRIIAPEGKLTLSKLTDPEQALGGFLTEDAEPTQRIDFTQHCITTYLQTLVDVDGGKM